MNRFGQTTSAKKRPLSLRILPSGGVFDQLTCKLHGDFDLNFSKHDNLFCGNRIELIFDSGETLGLSLSIKREMSPIARTRALLSGFKFPDSKPGKNVFSKNNRWTFLEMRSWCSISIFDQLQNDGTLLGVALHVSMKSKSVNVKSVTFWEVSAIERCISKNLRY